MKKFLAFIVLVAVVAAGLFAYRSYLISELRKPLLAQLSDPDSATFRNEKVVGPWRLENSIYCGEVNAKNRMGGYVGYRWFDGSAESSMIEDDAMKTTFDGAKLERCQYRDDPVIKWWWLRW